MEHWIVSVSIRGDTTSDNTEAVNMRLTKLREAMRLSSYHGNEKP